MSKEATNSSWVRVRQQLAGFGKALRTRRNFTGLYVWEITGVQHAGCSKWPFSKAAGEQEPEAYPPGYVEDSCELRTLPGERRVSARRGWASENSDFSSILIAGWLVALCMLAGAGCAAGHSRLDRLASEQSRLIDLTHSFRADTIVWPTEQDFRLILQQAGETAGGYYYTSNRLEMAEHGGTHIDAPIHFTKGGQTLDQIPIEHLVGAGIRINVIAQCIRDRDYLVTIQDFEQWEATHGRIPARAIVLVDTGFARYWPSRQQYLGTELRGLEGVRALHFPGVNPDAAAWLVRERQVKAVGIDTASIDYGQSTKFETHVTLLFQNVPVFENLGELRDLPDRGFDVIALPMKILGGTGGPLRVIAVLPPAH